MTIRDLKDAGREFSRILVVNVNWMGDVLFSFPVLKALRERYPQAYLACLVVPRCQEVAQGAEVLDEVIIYEEEGVHKSWRGKLALARLLRERRFDLAILLHRSFTRALLCWLAGIPERIGYVTAKRAVLLTQKTSIAKDSLHRIDYFLHLLQVTLGIPAHSSCYEFSVRGEDRDFAKQVLKEAGLGGYSPLVFFHPGGNWSPKRWPGESFARLGDLLQGEVDAKIVITGSSHDRDAAQAIQVLMRKPPLVLCGKTSIGQLAALFKEADLVVSSDSGPLHLASAVGTRTIGLFGPTSSKITGPRGRGPSLVLEKDVGCRIPCYVKRCTLDYTCMRSISPEEVFQKVKEAMGWPRR